LWWNNEPLLNHCLDQLFVNFWIVYTDVSSGLRQFLAYTLQRDRTSIFSYEYINSRRKQQWILNGIENGLTAQSKSIPETNAFLWVSNLVRSQPLHSLCTCEFQVDSEEVNHRAVPLQ
jgi:hypothetical protein